MLAEVPVRNVRDRVLLLTSFRAFANLSYDGLVLMAEHLRNRTFAAGQVIFEEGEPNQTVHIVVGGQVSEYRKGEKFFVGGRGDGIGFLTGMTETPGGIKAVADEPTQTLEVPIERIWNAYEDNFQLLRDSLRMSASQLLAARGNLPRAPHEAEEVELGVWRERTLTLAERTIVMRASLPGTNLDALIELARHHREVRIPAGTRLWEIGQPCTEWLDVEYGRIRCEAADGSSVHVGAGFGLGVMTAFAGQPHAFSAVAETDLIVSRIQREAVFAVLESHFDVARRFVIGLSEALLKLQVWRFSQRPPAP